MYNIFYLKKSDMNYNFLREELISFQMVTGNLFFQIVDFGEGGPVRCSRFKGYINPFMKFVDQGRRFVCNFCGEC